MFDELIKKINETTNSNELKNLLSDLHQFDIAEILTQIDDEKKLMQILSLFNNEDLADILSYLDPSSATKFFEILDAHKAADIINEMEVDDAFDIIDEMEKEDVEEIKEFLDKDTIEDLKIVAKYDDDTAGALMNPNFVKILSGSSLKEAMKELTRVAPSVETINTLFIVNNNDELLGVLDLKKLIVSRMPLTVDDIMLENFAYASVFDSISDAIKLVQDYDTIALPVLNGKVIEGIITMDDAMDAYTKESEEDYAQFAGLTTDEEKNESIFSSVKKRLPWLSILLVLDIIIALVISSFENVISKLTILTFFQAAVLGLSGNTGTQALAVTVRNLANGKNDKDELWKLILREIGEGLGTAIILGIVSFAFVFLMLIFQNKLGIANNEQSMILNVGLVLGLSVLISVFCSNIVGTILPIFFYKIKIDPAVASGPFITTINDVLSILIYFGTALIVMSNYLS